MKRDQSRSHLSWGLRKRPFLWCRLRAYLWSFMAWNSMLAIEYPPFYVIRISKLLSAHSTVQKPTKINKYIHTFSVQRNTYSRSFLTISKDTSATRYTLRFLLYVLVLHIIRTAHFHNCIPLPIIGTIPKKVQCTVNLYYCTAIPIIRAVLKNQACNIYKHWSYNGNLRVSSFSTFDVTNCFCNDWQKKVDKEKVSIISGHFL